LVLMLQQRLLVLILRQRLLQHRRVNST
jgi:hypothetical protein